MQPPKHIPVANEPTDGKVRVPSVRPLPSTPLPDSLPLENDPVVRPQVSVGSFGGVWVWLLAVLLIGGGTWYYFHAKKTDATKTESAAGGHGKRGGGLMRVVTATATKGDIGVYLSGLGTVTPLNTVTVKSRVDGELMKVLFTEGQMVKAGDLLVQIDSRPYDVQLGQAQGQLLHDQALLQNAKIDVDRYETLWKQDSISQQTLATQQALVTQYEGAIKTDQASVDSAKLNIGYCNITAPISGRIGLRNVDQGNLVHASDANGLLVITQIQPITVLFTIPEDSIQSVLPKLNAGQKLNVEAYSRNLANKLADGTLLTVDNQIDQTTGTLKLKALFSNENSALFPNQFVNVRLLVEMKKNVVLLPNAAVQHGTAGAFVYTVDAASSTVKMNPVTIGATDGGLSEVLSGISAGEVVVTDGVDKLQDGSKVQLSEGGDKNNPGSDSAKPHHEKRAETKS